MKLSDIFLSTKPAHQGITAVILLIIVFSTVYLFIYLLPGPGPAPKPAPAQWQIKKLDTHFINTISKHDIEEGWEPWPPIPVYDKHGNITAREVWGRRQIKNPGHKDRGNGEG